MSVEIIQKVIQQRPWVSVRRIAAQAGLQLISKHRIMRHTIRLFTNRFQTCNVLGAGVAFLNECETFTNAMEQQVNIGEIDMGYHYLGCF